MTLRVSIVTTGLGPGGVERVLANLIPELLANDFQVTLITLDQGLTDWYTVPSQCVRVRLAESKPSHSFAGGFVQNLQHLVELRRAIRTANPDVLLSCMPRTNIRARLASLCLGIPWVATEHAIGHDTPLIWRAFQRILYPYARKVTSSSQGVSDQFAWLNQKKLVKIFSLVKVNKNEGASLFVKDAAIPRIVFLGRLVEEKNPQLMLSAFHQLAKTNTKAELWFIGSGELEPELKSRALQLGLGPRVQFPGGLTQPFATLAQAHVLALSSNFEGFGNVLAEAMLLGIPVVSTDSLGPREIISDGDTGLLVPVQNAEALSNGINSLIADPAFANKLALAGQLSATQRFSEKVIVDQWLTVLNDAAANR